MIDIFSNIKEKAITSKRVEKKRGRGGGGGERERERRRMRMWKRRRRERWVKGKEENKIWV